MLNNDERLAELKREVEELRGENMRLENFRADVVAGCDIQRGGGLYRQVQVVIGPGKTQEELDHITDVNDLVARVRYLLTTYSLWSQDGQYTFPDGTAWFRQGENEDRIYMG